MRRKFVLGVLVAAIAALSVSTAALARPHHATLTTVKLGVYPSADYAPLFVGLSQGIFKHAGLDLKISYVYTGTGLMAGVTSGQFDMATNSVTAGVSGIINGLPIRIVTATDYTPKKGNTEVLVKNDSPIKTFKDLEGRKVATINVHGLFQLGVMLAMQSQGVDGNFTALAAAATDEPGQLRSGAVDAIVLQDPFLTQAKTQGGMRSLGNPWGLVKFPIPAGAFYASNSTIDSKADMLKTFVAAWKKAAAVAIKHPDLARRVISKYTGTPADVTAKMTPPDFTSAMPPASLGPMLQAMKKQGWITGTLPSYDKLVWTGK
jgi:NitT/TauT family transport system substrate-binding protein